MAKKTKKTIRFAAAARPEQDRVYFFRMNGCGHCESVKEIWPQVVSLIAQAHPLVQLIEVESAEKDRVLDNYVKQKLNTDQINAYPDLRILKRNGDTSTFNSERTVPALVAWIKANVTPSSGILQRVPTPYPGKSTTTHRRRLSVGKRKRKSHKRKNTHRRKGRRGV